LLASNRLVGVLCLYSSNRDAYSDDHERIIEVIARQVSGVVLEAHAEAHATERARSRSLKDQSTGLPNLRHFEQLVEAHLAEPDGRHPFCLVAMGFGVALVRSQSMDQVVTAVRRALRPADLLFSSATDELVALLLNTDSRTCIAIAARVGASLNDLLANGVIKAVKIGIACAPGEGSTGDELLALARERASKSGGQLGSNGAIH